MLLVRKLDVFIKTDHWFTNKLLVSVYLDRTSALAHELYHTAFPKPFVKWPMTREAIHCCNSAARPLFFGFLNAPSSILWDTDVSEVISREATRLGWLSASSSRDVATWLGWLSVSSSRDVATWLDWSERLWLSNPCESPDSPGSDCYETSKSGSGGNLSITEQILFKLVGIHIS